MDSVRKTLRSLQGCMKMPERNIIKMGPISKWNLQSIYKICELNEQLSSDKFMLNKSETENEHAKDRQEILNHRLITLQLILIHFQFLQQYDDRIVGSILFLVLALLTEIIPRTRTCACALHLFIASHSSWPPL